MKSIYLFDNHLNVYRDEFERGNYYSLHYVNLSDISFCSCLFKTDLTNYFIDSYGKALISDNGSIYAFNVSLKISPKDTHLTDKIIVLRFNNHRSPEIVGIVHYVGFDSCSSSSSY